MDEMKKCPSCGKEIKAEAKKCRYCGNWLEAENAQKASPAQNNTPNQTKSSTPSTDPYFNFSQGNDISLEEAILEPFKMSFKNFGWLILVWLVYGLTCWIPYLNIGTAIAMMNLPSALARGEKLSPAYIFESKYRKYMGEYLTMSGNIILIGLASMPFFGVPLLIVFYSWIFAPLLLIDKEVNASEAFTLSTKLTYGYKLKMWLSGMVIEMMIIIPAIILMFLSIFSGGLLFLVLLLFIALISSAHTAIFYKRLVVDKEKNN